MDAISSRRQRPLSMVGYARAADKENILIEVEGLVGDAGGIEQLAADIEAEFSIDPLWHLLISELRARVEHMRDHPLAEE